MDGSAEAGDERLYARERFAEVDGLRGLALAAIVAYQVFRFSGLPAYAPAAVARVFADAGQGLALFLVLSAFSLAYPLLAAIAADGSARLDVGRYAFRRALRIYPAYLAVLALAALLRPLATLFGFPALAHAAPAIDFGGFVRDAVFAGGGLGNDGLSAAGLFAAAYVVLPFLLALWLRSPRLALFLAIAATLVDTLTRAHGAGLALLVPLTLGIAAADLRVRDHRSQRLGLAVAAVAMVFAFVLESHVALLPGPLAVPNALRIDPFWSLACAGILVAGGGLPLARRILGFVALRKLSAPAYAISLVVMPIADFAARQLPPTLGAFQAAIVTLASAIAVGLILWQCVDRRFARADVRERLAARPGRLLDRVLARVRLATVVLAPPPIVVRTAASEAAVEDETPRVEAPRRRPGDLAVLSTRTGSPEDLAAEISETKRRLTDRAAPTEALRTLPAAVPEFEPEPETKPKPLPAVVVTAPVEAAVVTAPVVAAPVVEAPAAAAPVARPNPAPAPEPTAVVVPVVLPEPEPEPGPVAEFPAPAKPAPEQASPALASTPNGVAYATGPATASPAGGEPDTVATLTRLVQIVETSEADETEAEAPAPVAARPAIKMRIGPPRT